MFEILVYYVLPNVAMFGSLYAVAKYIEYATWHFIDNYDKYEKNYLTQKAKVGYK